MLLSALTLAALLQAAPMAVIPEAAPVVGGRGHLLHDKPYVIGQPVDQPRVPFRKKSHAWMGEEAFTRFTAPSQRRTKRAPPVKRDFAFNPQTVNCRSDALQKAARLDTLKIQPLSKLPKAHGERAVARLVDGCPVPVLVAQSDPLH